MIALLELIEELVHSRRDGTSFQETFHGLDVSVVIYDTVGIVSDDTETYIIDDGRPDLTLILKLVDDLLDLLISVMVINIIADNVADGESCKDQDTYTDHTQREMRCDKRDHRRSLSVKFLREIITRTTPGKNVLIVRLIGFNLLSCSSYGNINCSYVT